MTPKATLTYSVIAAFALVALFFAVGPLMALGALASLLVALAIWFWPTVGVVLMIVTGVGIPHLAAANSYIPISITQVVALLTIGSGAYSVWAHREQFTYAPHFIAIVAFLAIVMASTLLKPDMEQSRIGASTYLRAAMFVGVVACLAIRRSSFMTAALSLTAAVTLCSVLGVAEYAVPGFHIPSADDEQYERTGAAVSTFSMEDDSDTIVRVSGGTGNYNWLAYTIAVGLPLNLFWWRYAKSSLAKFIVLAATVAQFAALVLTYTRSGFIGLAAAVVFLIWQRRLPLWIPAAIIGVAALTSPLWMPQRFLDRVFSTKYLAQGTTTIRKDFAYAGWDMFLQAPIFGHGYGQFGPFFMAHSKSIYVPPLRDEIEKGAGTENDIRPHNLYVDLACDYGIIGLGAFAAFVVLLYLDLSAVRAAAASPTDADLALLMQSALIAFCVSGFFGNIAIMKIPWVLSGLAAALRRVAFTAPSAPNLTEFEPRGLANRFGASIAWKS